MENNANSQERIKERAQQYLPKKLDTVKSQQALLQMLVNVIPTIKFCQDKAEREGWPEVERGTRQLGTVVADCTYEVNKLIGITKIENLNLESRSEEALLGAWIALDYYAGILGQKRAGNICSLQARLSQILNAKTAEQTAEIPKTVAVDQTAMNQNANFSKTVAVDPMDMEKAVEMFEAMDAISKTETVAKDKTTTRTASRTDNTDNTDNTDWSETYTEKQDGGKKSGKGIVAIVAAVLAIVALLVIVPMFSAVSQTEKAIDQIGTVTLESGEQIEAAEQRYEELESDKKSRVENYSTLVAARSEYDRLVAEDAISQIGTVTMESEEAILHAEALYEALGAEQQGAVQNYSVLTAARKEYERLVAAVRKASDAIDAIGNVTLESGDKIKAARAAYDALAKDGLTEYAADKLTTLTKAENTYNQCVSDELYADATALYEKGKYQDAMEQFASIVKNYPGTTNASASRESLANCQIQLAQAAYKSGDQYEAMKLMTQVESAYTKLEAYTSLMEKIEAKLEKNRPANGKSIKSTIDWGYCYFKVTAGTEDICVKVEDTTDSTKYKLVYVRAGETTSIKVKDGTYALKFASGKYWYDKDHLFGDDTFYGKRTSSCTFNTTRSGSWVYYQYLPVSLYKNASSTLSITASQF